MVRTLLAMLLMCGQVDDAPEPMGKIQGVVVNGSRGYEPLEGIAVVLRAGSESMLIPVARARTDVYGRFVFDDVPIEPGIVLLPGADRGGVHYPGERVRLDWDRRFVHARIVAFDAVDAPSPLIARRHDIDVTVRQQFMEISETLLIANPTSATYVGQPVEEASPVTLRLSVPPDFDRITFDNEFYGRRFRIADRRPFTDIPWPPGERELKFVYRIPIEKSGGMFRRCLDVPTRNLTLRVHGKKAGDVSSNLTPVDGEPPNVAFASTDAGLPSGHTIELQVGTLPFPWLQYTRWGSLVALVALTVATAVVLRRGSSHEPQ